MTGHFCREEVVKEEAVRREDARAARPKDQPLRVLEVAQQLRRYGLDDLPTALKPSHADLNAFQHRLRLDTADMFAEVARLVAASSPDGSSFYSVGLDHKEAYRQLRARNDEVCRCAVAEDPNGAMRFFRMERLSFGEAAAVTHYNAFAKVLASVVRLV
ncbi:hypothetical protein DIPPA_16000 [Diplonema papillatum]|nr:hypothetical protein DIPPA_16000 [Diplonema papillatum]